MKNPADGSPEPIQPNSPEFVARSLTYEIINIMASCPTSDEVGEEAFSKVTLEAQRTIYQILLATIQTSMRKGRSMATQDHKPSPN